MFPFPRGVELHKPWTEYSAFGELFVSFRPLAGLSCINLVQKLIDLVTQLGSVSVPSRG